MVDASGDDEARPGGPGRASGGGDGSEGDLDLGDAADGGMHRTVDRLRLGGERAQRPLAVTREEPEVAGGTGRDLGGELAGAVEQAHVRAADRVAVTHDLALDDG